MASIGFRRFPERKLILGTRAFMSPDRLNVHFILIDTDASRHDVPHVLAFVHVLMGMDAPAVQGKEFSDGLYIPS